MMNFMIFLLLAYSTANNNNKTNPKMNIRAEKALSVFTVVKFPNTACSSSTTGRNGTCYTQSECQAKGGSSSGSCASSFGVCCVFEISCGTTLSENNTYFTSTAISKGSSCAYTVCKVHSNICQIRLDFETFTLNNPISAATSASPAVMGNLGNAGAFTIQGTCHVDTFGVSSPGSMTVPTICGTNTGEHMYVPAADQCNVISANIGSTSTSTAASFTIKVTQIPCNSPVLPPRGCLQYFYGSPSGTVASYNYQGSSGTAVAGSSQLLVNQHYNACIRTERTYCALCYWSPLVSAADGSGGAGFHMSVPGGTAFSLGFDTNCGALGVGLGVVLDNNGYAKGGAYDYVNIPSGTCAPPSPAIAAVGPSADRFCGTAFSCMGSLTSATAGAPLSTVCSSMKPFKLGVHSDGVEFIEAAIAEAIDPNNAGFNLNYFMKTDCLYYDTLAL